MMVEEIARNLQEITNDRISYKFCIRTTNYGIEYYIVCNHLGDTYICLEACSFEDFCKKFQQFLEEQKE